MKKFTPIALIILSVVIGSCSDDDSLGNRLDHIRYYDIVFPGSGFVAEKQFYYDDEGRVLKTVTENVLGHTDISEYTYSENWITVNVNSDAAPGSETVYRLKFENDLLTRYVIAQQAGELVDTDSVDFLYESGKLSSIKFGENSYPVTVDDAGNITSYVLEETEGTVEYDNRPNPLKNLPSGFIFLSFTEGIENQVRFRGIVEFFSHNNPKLDGRKYSYQDGKVVKIMDTYGTRAEFYYRDK